MLSKDGSPPLGAILTKEKLNSSQDLEHLDWQLLYFRIDCFSLPDMLWEKINQPIRFVGETVPVTIETDFGKRDCFIKCRVAGYIA